MIWMTGHVTVMNSESKSISKVAIVACSNRNGSLAAETPHSVCGHVVYIQTSSPR